MLKKRIKSEFIRILVFILFFTLLCGCKRKQSVWARVVNKDLPCLKGWKYIVIHHSGTKSGSVESFHKHHLRLGIGGLGYHFIIGNGNGMKDGEIKAGFRWKKQISGCHVSRAARYHNVFGIGICLVGNFERTKPTKKQIKSLVLLIKKLIKKYGIKTTDIIGHKHVVRSKIKLINNKLRVKFLKAKERTLCPGKNLKVADVRKKIDLK